MAVSSGPLFLTSRSGSRGSADQLAHELVATRQRLAILFEATPAGLAVSIADSGLFEVVNQALCDLVGYRREELIGRSAASIMHPEDAAHADSYGAIAKAAPDHRTTARMRLIHKTGRIVVVDITLTWIDDDGVSLLLAQMVDVGRYMAESEALRIRSETDALTGLANRVHLTRVLAEMGEEQSRGAILFLDLDGFKPVNDTRGHAAGDEVLASLAAPLRAAAGPHDLVSRVGGDEFVIVCRPGPMPTGQRFDPLAAALEVASNVAHALAQPLQVSSGPVQLTVSIGISDGRIAATSPLTMLEHADMAMYAAKQRGKNQYVVYDESMHSAALSRHDTMMQIQHAVSDGRTSLEYQAIVDLATSLPVGYAAQLRVTGTDGRPIPNQDVTGSMRQIGMAHPLAQWAFEHAATEVAQHNSRTGSRQFLNIMLTGRHTSRADLHSRVSASLARTGLRPTELMLALPEAALTDLGAGSSAQLCALRRDGVRITIADYGSGPASLTVLEQVAVTDLTLSSRLTAPGAGSGAANTLRAILQIARGRDIRPTATGIDTAEELAFAAEAGIPFGQGAFLAAPVEALPAA